jgi:hypothetical protein
MGTIKQQILNKKEELGLLHDGFFYDDKFDSRSVIRSEMKRMNKKLDTLFNLSCGVVLTVPNNIGSFIREDVNQEVFRVLFYNDDVDSLEVIINDSYFVGYSADDLLNCNAVNELQTYARNMYSALMFYLDSHLSYLRENNYDTIVYIGKVYGGTRMWFTTIEEYERCCK